MMRLRNPILTAAALMTLALCAAPAPAQTDSSSSSAAAPSLTTSRRSARPLAT